MKPNQLFILLIFRYLIIAFIPAGAQGTYDRGRLQMFYQDQEYEQALDYLNRLPPTEDAQYLMDLGYANYVNNKAKEAKSIFTKLYQLNNALPVPQLYLALLFDQSRDFDSALFYYKNLTLLQPNNYKYWQAAAKNLVRSDSLNTALQYIRKAYELSPLSGSVVYDLAACLQKQKKIKDAENIIDQFLDRDTTYDPVIGQKTALCFDAKRYTETIHWGERYKRLEGGSSGPYINLLYSYLNTGKPDSVISLYQWLELTNRMSESVAYGAALAYAAQKDFTQSDSLLSICVRFNIQEMAAVYLRAKARNAVAIKNYKNAIALYDTSYYIFHDPMDLFFSGSVYDQHLNDRAKAVTYYRRFLRARPQPLNPDETRITRYIRDFLNPQKR